MSITSTIGLNIIARDSVFSRTPNVIVDDLLGDKIDRYSHKIDADGGYVSADFNLSVSFNDWLIWLSQGLSRDILVVAHDGTEVWRGFVNRIQGQAGSLSVTVGPVTDIVNRGKVIYRTKRWDTNPPVGGVEKDTAYDDGRGQEIHGSWSKNLNGGEATVATAFDLRELFLSEGSLPSQELSLSLGGGSNALSLSISCAGYREYLNAYDYTASNSSSVSAKDSGDKNISSKVADIVLSDPNGLFTDTSKIDENVVQVESQSHDQETAMQAIQRIVAIGDGTNRWTFGIYENNVPYYRKIPDEALYEYVIAEDRIVISSSRTPVDLWNVRPAQFLLIPVFAARNKIYRSAGSAVRLSADTYYTTVDTESSVFDLSIWFIESVTFSAPNTIQISANRVGKLDQRIAQLGLGYA